MTKRHCTFTVLNIHCGAPENPLSFPGLLGNVRGNWPSRKCNIKMVSECLKGTAAKSRAGNGHDKLN